MKTRIIILLSFVFALTTTPLWTACSVEDVPVPVEEPEEEPGAGQPSGRAPLFGVKWICVSPASSSDPLFSYTIPVGSYVCLQSDGTIDSDMPVFPKGSTYVNLMDAVLLVTTPNQTVAISINYVKMDEMEWWYPTMPSESITLRLKAADDSQYQNETNNHGGGTIVPVGH